MGRKRKRNAGEWTTISILKVVKDDLDTFGKHSENYNDIVKRVLEEAKKGKKEKKIKGGTK